MTTIRNMLVTAAWNSWREWALEQARIAYKLKGAIMRMMMRQLSMAFEQWQYVTEEANRLKYVLSGAIRRMQNIALSKGWEQWQFWYEEVKAQQFILAGAIRRMLKRKLSMAWEQWQYWYEELMAQKNLLESALRKWAHMKLFAAFNKWNSMLAYPEPEPTPVLIPTPVPTAPPSPWLPGSPKFEHRSTEKSGLEFLVPFQTTIKRGSRWDIPEMKEEHVSKAYVQSDSWRPSTYTSRVADRGRRKDGNAAEVINVTSYNARIAEGSGVSRGIKSRWDR